MEGAGRGEHASSALSSARQPVTSKHRPEPGAESGYTLSAGRVEAPRGRPPAYQCSQVHGLPAGASPIRARAGAAPGGWGQPRVFQRQRGPDFGLWDVQRSTLTLWSSGLCKLRRRPHATGAPQQLSDLVGRSPWSGTAAVGAHAVWVAHERVVTSPPLAPRCQRRTRHLRCSALLARRARIPWRVSITSRVNSRGLCRHGELCGCRGRVLRTKPPGAAHFAPAGALPRAACAPTGLTPVRWQTPAACRRAAASCRFRSPSRPRTTWAPSPFRLAAPA